MTRRPMARRLSEEEWAELRVRTGLREAVYTPMPKTTVKAIVEYVAATVTLLTIFAFGWSIFALRLPWRP